jgi:uncharacterized membrane protein
MRGGYRFPACAKPHESWFSRLDASGLLLMAIFLIWIAVAQAIYVATFGYLPAASMPDFLRQVLTTPAGWTLIVVGNGVGFLFAVTVLIISVVSFPLLIDRDVGAAGAIVTSARVVLANPVIMAVWGFIVAALLVLGTIPLLFGLAVVMPVLGHATWHLYRRAVEPNDGPAPELRPEPTGKRYAAEFPASLFARSRDDTA